MFGNKTLKYKSLLDLYMNCFKSADVNSYANRQAVLTLPNINPIIINDLFDDARKFLKMNQYSLNYVHHALLLAICMDRFLIYIES